jgi:ferritin-like metal-binding protein YciE
MATIVQYLNEAHATEQALVTTLQAHITMTPHGAHRELLVRHLAETRQHARALERRLADLDAGPGLLAATVGLAETLVGQALALAKGPVDLLRGGSAAEKQLKNAKDECATEALEIATYDALEALAEALGDAETARLAAVHRADEERTLAALRDLIPALARAVGGAGAEAQDDVPIAGYDGLNVGQVVARLADLSQAQLRAVAAYERAGRARRTVLERIDALQADEPWAGYDEASEAAVLRRLGDADADTAARVRAYEARHRRRVPVLEAAQRQPAR